MNRNGYEGSIPFTRLLFQAALGNALQGFLRSNLRMSLKMDVLSQASWTVRIAGGVWALKLLRLLVTQKRYDQV